MQNLVGGVPHHVPIRKENRWEAIQHYTTTPNNAAATPPTRRPGISELLMPERQESISSYISQYSAQNRHALSNRSLTSYTSREEDDDSSKTPFSPRQPRRQNAMVRRNMLHKQSSVQSLRSSPSSQNSRYTSNQQVSSKSLFSKPSLTTTYEEKKNDDEKVYKDYTINLDDFLPPLTHDVDATMNDSTPSKLGVWFQYVDDSSAVDEPVTKPNSGRSLIPVIPECHETVATASTDDNCTASESDSSSFAISEISPARESPKANVTEESVRKVLRECGTSSRTLGEESTVSEASSTRLNRLRERVKRLREKSNQQIEQSRSQFQSTRDTSEETSNAPNEIPETPKSVSKSRNPSKATAMKVGQSNRRKEVLRERSPSMDSQTSSLDSQTSSLDSYESYGRPKKREETSPKNVTWKIQDNFHHNSKPSKAAETLSETLASDLRKELTEEVRSTSYSFNPHSSLSSRCASIAEETAEHQAEDGLDSDSDSDTDTNLSSSSSEGSSVTEEDVLEPEWDPEIDINSSFESSKQAAVEEQDLESLQDEEEDEEDEDLQINSSFDSSNCASIAEEAVKSLQAERLNINSSFDSSKSSSASGKAVRSERKYDSHIHVTRTYSMSPSTPTDSPLEQKLKRGRRPKSSRSLTSKQEAEPKKITNHQMVAAARKMSPRKITNRKMVSATRNMSPRSSVSETRNIMHDLKEALAIRGPPIEPEEERKGSWCDPFKSDGIKPLKPLASKDSLSSPIDTPPRSFREKRNAYLNSVGDSDETRKQSPFTTANLVLGKLPEKTPPPPFVDSASQNEEVLQGAEDASSAEEVETKSFRGRPRKWTSRRNVRKNMTKDVENAGRLSPGRSVKKWMSPKNLPNDSDTNTEDITENSDAARGGRRSSRVRPLREGAKSDTESPNWAQNSFVDRFGSSSQCKGTNDAQPPPSRRLVRSKSSKAQEDDSKGDNPPRKPSSTRLVKDEERESISIEPSPRRLVRSKSSKEKDAAFNRSSKSLVRTSSKSSLDNEREGRQSSRRLVRSASKSSVDEERDTASQKPSSRRLVRRSSSKSSGDKERKGSSRRIVRSNSKSSVERSKSPKLLRSPTNSPGNRRDCSHKSYGEMDTPPSTKKEQPSSWRAGKRSNNVSQEDKAEQKRSTKTPTSGRFGSKKRFGTRNASKDRDNSTKKPSSGRFSGITKKLSRDNGETKKASSGRFTQKPSSGRFSGITKKLSRDNGDAKKPSSGRFSAMVGKSSSKDKEDKKSAKVSYRRLSESSSEDTTDNEKRPSSMKFYQFTPNSSSSYRSNVTVVEDKRDDSNRSIDNYIVKPKHPSSWRESSFRKVGRNYSHKSRNTQTTVESEPSSSSDNSSSSSSRSSSANEDTQNPIAVATSKLKTNKNNNEELNTSNHGRRTRPRRSNIRRLTRYKDYRKNGILVAEHKRFSIDMTGGIE